MEIRNVIFDLDGTLLDTLVDIQSAINDALACCGFSYSFSFDEAKKLIGDGADALVHRALKTQDSPDNFSLLKAAYMPRYRDYQGRHTHPFPGIVEMLQGLSKMGLKLFVASNKPDSLAKAIVSSKIGDSFFCEVCGQREGDLPKPNPIQVFRIFERYGIDPARTLYCGDSHVDIETAQNAKIPVALCLWGYDSYLPSLLSRADFVLRNPSGLLDLAKKK